MSLQPYSLNDWAWALGRNTSMSTPISTYSSPYHVMCSQPTAPPSSPPWITSCKQFHANEASPESVTGPKMTGQCSLRDNIQVCHCVFRLWHRSTKRLEMYFGVCNCISWRVDFATEFSYSRKGLNSKSPLKAHTYAHTQMKMFFLYYFCYSKC